MILIFFPVKAECPYFSFLIKKSKMAPIKWRQFCFEVQSIFRKYAKIRKKRFFGAIWFMIDFGAKNQKYEPFLILDWLGLSKWRQQRLLGIKKTKVRLDS